MHSPLTTRSLDLLGAVAAAYGAGRGQHLYRALLAAIAFDVDATYCRLLLVSGTGWVSVPATIGRRPPPLLRQRAAVRLEALGQIRLTLDEQRLVALKLDVPERATPEDAWLFSVRTQRGLIVPFTIGTAGRGALIIGEERATRGRALSPDGMDLVQRLADRVGEILGQRRAARARHLAERRSERTRVQRLERARLSRQLHDSVGQSLNTLLVQIRLAVTKGDAGIADLRLMELSAREALDSARALAYEMRRPGADVLEAARVRIESMARDSGSSLTWVDQRRERRLNGDVAEALAAAIKESILNASHHGQADTITVKLDNQEESVRVTISDNGVGFAPETVTVTPDGRGLGLLGISERLEAVGGLANVSSTPGEGAIVALQVSAGPPARLRGLSSGRTKNRA